MNWIYKLFDVVPRSVLRKVRNQRNECLLINDGLNIKITELEHKIIRLNDEILKLIAKTNDNDNIKVEYFSKDYSLDVNNKVIKTTLNLSEHKNIAKIYNSIKSQKEFKKELPIFKEYTRYYRMVDGWKFEGYNRYNFRYNNHGRLIK